MDICAMGLLCEVERVGCCSTIVWTVSFSRSDTLHVSLRPAVIPSASIHAPVKCVLAAAG